MRSINHLSDEAMLLETKLKPEKKSLLTDGPLLLKKVCANPKLLKETFRRGLR